MPDNEATSEGVVAYQNRIQTLVGYMKIAVEDRSRSKNLRRGTYGYIRSMKVGNVKSSHLVNNTLSRSRTSRDYDVLSRVKSIDRRDLMCIEQRNLS